MEEKELSKNGKLDGLCEWWYDNGQLDMAKTYKDGKEDGPYEWWYPNGQVMLKEHYKNGKRDGLCEKWTINGEFVYRENYICDKLYESFDGTGRVTLRNMCLDLGIHMSNRVLYSGQWCNNTNNETYNL